MLEEVVHPLGSTGAAGDGWRNIAITLIDTVERATATSLDYGS